MSGKTIGLNMNNGFAGSYARQPDMVITTKPNTGAAAIPFGTVLMQNGIGVKAADASLTATNFVGFAARQIQTKQADTGVKHGGKKADHRHNDIVYR